jgi:pimeloyl-ACP methyl ester carboxylesterase/nucleoside-diphosphate-sugar epimerase
MSTLDRASHPGSPDVLVTGATGLVGRWLLAALTRRGHTVAALVRGADARREELASFVARLGGDRTRLVVVEGDVEREDLGLRASLSSVRVVHHLAARFAFGLTRDEARRANVLGTEHVVRWAASLPALERFVFLGGYRMTATPLAALDAAALERHYAAGAYEGSKIEAYVRFRQLASELGMPWTAVHPSSVIGDSRSGRTTQLTGLGETVQRLFEGRMPALVGSERTFVPVVTVDYLAEYLATVSDDAACEGRDLVVFDPASPALPGLVKQLADVLGVEAPRWTLPLGLVRALPSRWTGLHPESAGFLVEDRYDTQAGDAHAVAAGLVHPDLGASLARWCAFLVASRFLAIEPGEARVAFEEGVFVVGDPREADVVLLHGIPFDGEAMAPLADALAARGVSCARLDLPGLGRSGPLASEAGAADLAWLERRLAARTRPLVVVGHSLGAAIATRYAAAHPDEVAAVVLVAPAFLTTPASWTLRLSPLVAQVLGGLDAARFRARFLAEGAGGPGVEAATQSALVSLARLGAASRYACALADAVGPASRAAAHDAWISLRVPAVIVHARREPLVADVRGAHVVTLEDAGHNPQLTHLEATLEATLSLLEASRSESRDQASEVARRRRSAKTPPAVTSGPAPGPRTTSGWLA